MGSLTSTSAAPAVLGLARSQGGVVSLQQALSAGMSLAAWRHAIESGRCRRIHRGAAAVHTGPLGREGERWAAVLACGAGAILSHLAAAEVHRLVEATPGAPIDVAIPATRRVIAPAGVRVHRVDGLDAARHPGAHPPRLRVEDTVLMLARAAATPDDAMAAIFNACQRGRTTPERLRAAIQRYPRLRWRDMLIDATEDACTGTQSLLEQTYLHRVVRSHGLPEGRWQVAEQTSTGLVRRDVYLDEFATIVELDGRLGHDSFGRFRDMRRDNDATTQGKATLRFGWVDVHERACDGAGQLAAVITIRGWTSRALRCGSRCRVPGAGESTTWMEP